MCKSAPSCHFLCNTLKRFSCSLVPDVLDFLHLRGIKACWLKSVLNVSLLDWVRQKLEKSSHGKTDIAVSEKIAEKATFHIRDVKTDMGATNAISRLYIANANKKDSGNYSCALTDVAAATTVSIHVLNGENPAAMQHGGSAILSATFVLIVAATLLPSLLR
ncbi:unnamed protein product [Xylocopa violacea]|uniref:Ig-like domain-containing protein n=1 Tax=Xylocopa violacea TaxID=135666 RepID=A0ABP1NT83_XYLVO